MAPSPVPLDLEIAVRRLRVPKLLPPSEVGGKQGLGNDSPESGVIDGRAFYRFQAQPQQLKKPTMLETVWIGKDTFEFSAVA